MLAERWSVNFSAEFFKRRKNTVTMPQTKGTVQRIHGLLKSIVVTVGSGAPSVTKPTKDKSIPINPQLAKQQRHTMSQFMM